MAVRSTEREGRRTDSSSTSSRITRRSGDSVAPRAAQSRQSRIDQLGGRQGPDPAAPVQHARAVHIVVVAHRPKLRRPPPAAARSRGLPPAEAVADLFVRPGEATLCAKSTVTFAYFAQWFTDGFLRSDRSVERDPRRNDATHEIDPLPIYGVRPSWTEQLREHEGGRLKSQRIGGAEFPPYLCEAGEKKPEFSEIGVVRPEQIPPERRDEAVRGGQRHDELADRLRDDGHAVPARAQPDRRAAGHGSTPRGTTSASSRPRATS